MAEPTFSFQVGTFQCTSVTDGVSKRDFESVADRFPAIPHQEFLESLSKAYPEQGPLNWSMNCLFIETDEHKILVDTGIGPRKEGQSGKLVGLLKEIVDLSQVDAVIITHCHADHIGGLVNLEGELTFPNAEYFMHEEEWEHWMGQEGVVTQAEEEYVQFLRSKLQPIRQRLTFIHAQEEFISGIRAVAAPGHTPGHIGLLLESSGETLLNLSDTLHTRVQFFHPEWSPRFDTDPEQAAQTRREMLSLAADEGYLTLFYHLALPGLGTIQRDADIFQWQPWEGEK
jgi:glyoxylase-like metal-dependent hydrolase (beta-lactamase superfamily II)